MFLTDYFVFISNHSLCFLFREFRLVLLISYKRIRICLVGCLKLSQIDRVILLLVVFVDSSGSLFLGLCGHIKICHVGNAHLDTYIQEDCNDTESEMTIFQRAANSSLLLMLNLALLCLFKNRFRQFREEKHNQCECKNAHCNKQCRTCSTQREALQSVAHKIAYKHRADCRSQRVGRATELQQLVALIATTTKRVEHRVYNSVEHTHRETSHKRAS